MSHHLALQKSFVAVGALALLLAGFECASYANSCLPQIPAPCAADGVCRPNRGTWGYSKTRWRPWPGETVGQGPTPADAAGEADEKALAPFETPPPEEENLRGPAKSKKAKADEEADVEIPPMELPGIPPAAEGPAADESDPFAPGPEALPVFDPQTNQSEVPATPSMDDAPPALPASLRQAARQLSAPQSEAMVQPIRQASWKQPTSIALINPASAIVAPSDTEPLQQAIYYEASDQ